MTRTEGRGEEREGGGGRIEGGGGGQWERGLRMEEKRRG